VKLLHEMMVFAIEKSLLQNLVHTNTPLLSSFSTEHINCYNSSVSLSDEDAILLTG
jgi:hypothetical protein